jgi:ABC-type sugar transport system permease subunit
MIQRCHINRITRLENDQGEKLLTHKDIEQELINFYKNLLSEPIQDRSTTISKITQHIPALITEEQNTALIHPITIEEVDQDMKEMPPGKAPGPNGFTTDFFHHCWPMIREEVWKIVEDSRLSKNVLLAFNATFLTLIPKEERTTHPKQFIPITLCNVIYKIITKVIAMCLKIILPFIISKEQSGYVEGRQILDNIILAHEVIHSLKSSCMGMIIKLDFSKAFDTISWKYMQQILTAFGFHPDWISWILNLTSSIFFSILVNGAPSKTFSPTRGIRQGDPLSPFLFVILAEGLSHHIQAHIASGALQGLKLHGMDSPISHSQFVDDTMTMGSSTAKESSTIRTILDDFSTALGISINAGKSQVFFFNTPESIQIHLENLLGFTRISLPSKYLEAPLTDNPSCLSPWEPLLTSLDHHLQSWTFRSLNLAGRLTLLKSVLQAIPLYLFSALVVPKSIINSIRSIQINFLWQGTKEGRKWALVKWEDLYKPKASGGLDLRDPRTLNRVLGAKNWWRWLTHPFDPWAKLWRRKYSPNLEENKLIRITNQILGSSIWNVAYVNHSLIQKHAF